MRTVPYCGYSRVLVGYRNLLIFYLYDKDLFGPKVELAEGEDAKDQEVKIVEVGGHKVSPEYLTLLVEVGGHKVSLE